MKNEGFTNVFTAIRYPYGFHPIKTIKHFFRTWKWAWQRATTGVCDMDTWDMDEFYLDLFINSLTLFKKKTQSYPYNMTEEEWNAKIDEMIDAFKRSRIDDDCNPYNEEYTDYVLNTWKANGLDGLNNEEDKGKEIREKYLNEETRLYKEAEANFRKGLDLLAEYHNDLWW